MSGKVDNAQKKDTDKSKPSQTGEAIIQIPLDELFPLRDHPFSVNDDDLMEQTVSSVQSYGVLVPGIVRPREDGGYEIIAGHRRHHACGLAGLTTMPCVVRNVDYDTAVILMVDSNIQRENTPISERANGVWEQRLTIHYNCIGAIDIPDVLPLPYPDVSVNTRKGVVVTYVPNTLAG